MKILPVIKPSETQAAIRLLPPAEPETKTPTDWTGLLRTSALSLGEIQALNLPTRRAICGDWFNEAGIGFVFAPRGVGKTWFSLWLAICISKGQDFAHWKCPEAKNILYLDGEMPVGQMNDRIKSLCGEPPETFKVISHEVLWHKAEKVFSLTDKEQQSAITQTALELGTSVLFLDNLSALMPGIAENDNDDWALKVLPWILDLRRRGIALVIVHHAGRNGKMRGASRKEDHPDWIIQLSESQTNDAGRFVASFAKPPRGARETCPVYDWHFKALETGETLPIARKAGLPERMLQAIDDGLTSCGDLATELGVSKGLISRTAKQLKAEGKIEINGREYAIR